MEGLSSRCREIPGVEVMRAPNARCVNLKGACHVPHLSGDAIGKYKGVLI